jgi:hypothetical protein
VHAIARSPHQSNRQNASRCEQSKLNAAEKQNRSRDAAGALQMGDAGYGGPLGIHKSSLRNRKGTTNAPGLPVPDRKIAVGQKEDDDSFSWQSSLYQKAIQDFQVCALKDLDLCKARS